MFRPARAVFGAIRTRFGPIKTLFGVLNALGAHFNRLMFQWRLPVMLPDLLYRLLRHKVGHKRWVVGERLG